MKYLVSLFFLFCVGSLQAASIQVGKSKSVTSLRKAIDNARDGDTVYLHKGFYQEGNIIITKSICLIGIDNPILDGQNKYEIITISGSGITVEGIRFQNSGYSSMNDYASIGLIDASYCKIQNNIIEHAYFAIHVANSSYCIISGNKIKGDLKTEQMAGNGIHLWKCNNMAIENNEVQGQRDGIYFEFVTESYIVKNNSHNNIRYGLHFMFSNNDSYLENIFKDNGAGVAVMYSHHVLMHSNTFDHNWGPNAYGLLLKEISDASIVKNKFIQNTVGILMESTNRINVFLNDFQSSGWALRIQASCNESGIYCNNFTGNTFDIATNGTMMLSKYANNYWDKYEGYDLNKDGVGDVAYHPVSMYSMVVEQNPNSLLLLRSFMVSLLDKAEKAIPSFTPEFLVDDQPLMRRISL